MIAAGFWEEGLLLSGGCVVLVRVNLWLELVVPAKLVPKHGDAVGRQYRMGWGVVLQPGGVLPAAAAHSQV